MSTGPGESRPRKEPLPEAEDQRDGRSLAALREAQQRLVFFECLHAQARVTADRTRAELDRLRDALAAAERRESELRERMDERERLLERRSEEIAELSRRLGQTESRRSDAEARLTAESDRLSTELTRVRQALDDQRRQQALQAEKVEDARRRADSLESANERLFTKIFQLHKLVEAGQPEEFDLAEFISAMRAEVLSLQHLLSRAQAREAALSATLEEREGARGSRASSALGAPEAACEPPLSGEAGSSEPRTPAAPRQPDADEAILQQLVPVADRSLAQHHVAALRSESEPDRLRAAGQLVDLIGPRAAAFVAAAAQGCRQAECRAGLVLQLGRAGDPALFDQVARFARDGSAAVRLSALDACCALVDGRQQEWIDLLHEGLADDQPQVRRRALIHLTSLRGGNPGPLGSIALDDPDASVRRLACLCLSATRDPHACLALLQASLDEDEQVSRVAATAVERQLGAPAVGLAELPRPARRIAVAKLTAYVEPSLSRLAPEGRLLPPRSLGERIPKEVWARGGRPGSARAPAQPTEAAPVKAAFGYDAICSVLQVSLRGCTENALAEELACEPDRLGALIEQLVGQGRLVRRGRRLFLP